MESAKLRAPGLTGRTICLLYSSSMVVNGKDPGDLEFQSFPLVAGSLATLLTLSSFLVYRKGITVAPTSQCCNED